MGNEQTMTGVTNALLTPTQAAQSNSVTTSNTDTNSNFEQVLQEIDLLMTMADASSLNSIGSFDGTTGTTSSSDPLGLGSDMSAQSMSDPLTQGASAPSTILSLLPNFLLNSASELNAVGQTVDGSTSMSTGSSSVQVPSEYQGLITQTAEKYSISPNLLAAVIHQESSFNPTAQSSAGAQGLMQLMPGTAKALGVNNPMDPLQNIDGGAKYLQQLLQKFQGNVPFALAAYNAGPSAVEKYNGIPPYRETENYVNQIMSQL